MLGLNGAGKSTLLRIIAGVDQYYIGEIFMSKGHTVGLLLEQEPRLEETGTVISVVKEAVRPILNTLFPSLLDFKEALVRSIQQVAAESSGPIRSKQ